MSPRKETSLLRLYLLRACYALLAFGLGAQIIPVLFLTSAQAPLYEGVTDAMLAALAMLSLAGLVAPLRMLPLLVFEVVWKALWTIAVALPQWLGDRLTDATTENLFAVALVIPFIVIIPWRHFVSDLIDGRERFR